MNVLERINSESGKNDLSFLIIGGHAVNTYGVQRTTADIDLLVDRQERDSWKSLILKMNYEATHEADNFIQFRHKELGHWPLDLMFVDTEIFEKLLADSESKSVGNNNVKVPKVEHLIALKLHALKEDLAHRENKDTQDVIDLIRIQDIDFKSEEFKALCLKYVSQAKYEEICKKSERN